MKRALIGAALAALFSTSVFSSVHTLHCTAKKGEIEITLNARIGLLDGENKVGLIKRFDLLVQDRVEAELNGIEFKGHTSISDSNVANQKYNGQKYKGYLKFNLINYKSEDFRMNGGIEDISLIVSPEYKVVNTRSTGNHWDEDWTWDVETREFDAVFPINLDDHHGDYIRGKCYGTAKVNEVKP